MTDFSLFPTSFDRFNSVRLALISFGTQISAEIKYVAGITSIKSKNRQTRHEIRNILSPCPEQSL